MNAELSDFVAQNAWSLEPARQATTMIAAFEAAAAEGFHLAGKANLNETEIMQVIATLSNRPVEKIILVSVTDPRLAIRNGETASELARDTEDSLRERLYSRNHSALWEELGHERGNKIMSFLEDDLARLVDKLVSDCLAYGNSELRRMIQRHLYYPLAYFIGFALTGNTERMNRIEPVLRLMLQGIIPIAEKKGAPRTWYALVA
ncbi:MAG: hypothetical protein WCT10_05270 [Patescibacteria group bacterium]